ncbi:MAG: DNA mismatch repair endonuclease MutL [Nitrospirae bacterium]|nr:DNA mismatch repair endonuclease MutL [Nitrospirota bacterium]
MPLIKILPVDLRNKIAAGEVVERPAAVVKELVENSIDAKSTEISVEVLHGGKRMIKISDNGTGMDREDALLCFEPHATSKLSTDAGLFNITTMGFRGEALPSIASVSKIKLITGLKGADSGVSVELIGGQEKEIKDAPFSGTSVEVKDLFFNTPARKKFLKTNSTELYHIIDIVTKEALSHPEISFSLITDNHETMILPKASGFRERIMQIYGDEFLSGLIEINNSYSDIKMESFLSNTSNFRNNKTYQFLFINRRPVKDPSVSHAVYSAYEGILPKDRHPVFFLFLELDPKKVDFNVHPTKREARFEDKEGIHRFLRTSIRDAIKEERAEYTRQFTELPGEVPVHTSNYEAVISHAVSEISENTEFVYQPSLPFIYMGDTFIAISGKSGLEIIDYHAAHERILYERLLKKINLSSHHLLFPEQIKLSHKEYRIMLENKGILHEFGIDIDDFGHDTIIVRSLPDALSNADTRGILLDIASAIIEDIAPNKSVKEALAARIACHKSVRGRKLLTQEEFSRLLTDLENAENPDQCPHGRPTRIFFSLDDLKKIFKKK